MSTSSDFLQQLLALFETKAKEKIFKKGDMILKEGEVENHLYFIAEGAVRVFLLTEHEEHTIRFGYKNSIINSLSSYIRESGSEFYLEALRKTTLRVITKKDITELVESSPENQRGYIRLLEELVTQTIDREIDLLTPSPSERLNRVLKRSPLLFQEIPLKYIASYLRMTPETLSRLRNS